MGHDISGFNRSGSEICYVRFSMWNPTADLFYTLFDAEEFNGGVSGIGANGIYSEADIEKALDRFYEIFGSEESIAVRDDLSDFAKWERKEILKFLRSCLDTARKEGSVRVAFA